MDRAFVTNTKECGKMALRHERMRLGDLLIKQKVLTEEELKKALQLQKGTGKKIGEVLVDNGMITEDMIARALQAQLGMKLVHLTGITIPKDVRNLVNVNILKKYQCIPFELDPYNANILHLAMADPMDMAAIDDISIITNLQVEPYKKESFFVEMMRKKQRQMSAMHLLYSWYAP